MLDFKNDFASDSVFLQRAQLDCCYVSFDGLPFNPLIPAPLRRPGSDTEYIAISEHINGLVDIFRTTFGLGDQQEVAVKNAIRESFEERGIPSKGTIKYDSGLNFPDFNDVGQRLQATNQNAYNRLDPLFDLEIFPASSRDKSFNALLEISTVVDVSQIQNDRIKNAVAKILVMSAHRYYNSRPHSGVLTQFFVFDEAHRILDSEFLLKFVRECRAYGVGVLLSSQYPTDFPPDISASLNTKIIHGNEANKDRVKDIIRLVGNGISDERIAELAMFQAIVTNPQYPPVIVNTLSYPMLLLLDSIGTETVSVDKLVVNGVDSSRLDISHLVGLLMKMGMLEKVSNGIRRTAS
jgi:DNA phosphorothioation-dependent restriction protein DptH